MDDLAPAPEAPVDFGETGEPRVPHRLFALKDRDTFVVADAFGDIVGHGDGLFHNDTRILSRFRLLLGAHSPSSFLLNGFAVIVRLVLQPPGASS